MDRFSLPHHAPAPGLAWVAGGLPAHGGGLAAQRLAARLALLHGAAGPAADVLAMAREVTLLPALPGAPALAEVLPGLRALAPEAVLRLEWWLEGAAPSGEDIAALRAAQPLFVHAVLTAPAQVEAAADTLRRLADAGIPLAAELLLRRGGFDALEAVRDACLRLLTLGTRPYHLVDGAWLPAEARVPRDAALEIVRGLRGWISGLAVPQLVEESEAGVRVPVVPAYVERLDDGGVEVVNYEGRRLRYANPPAKPGEP